MRRLLKFFLPGLLFLTSLREAGAVSAVVDRATFRDSLMQPYLKLFWEIDPRSLHYRRDAQNLLRAKVRTEIRVYSDTGIIFRDNYFMEPRPHELGTSRLPQVIEQLRLPLPRAGAFRVQLRLSEEGFSAGVFNYTDSGLVAAGSAPFYSSLQLIDTFVDAASAPGLPKQLIQGGYANLPKPFAFYNEGERRLNGYFELYHTDSLPASAYPLVQTVYISRKPLQRIAAEVFLRDTIRNPSARQGFHRTLSLSTLRSDNYYVNISLQDASGRERGTATTMFQLMNKTPEIDSTRSGPVAITDTAADAGKLTEAFLDLGTTFVAKFDMARLRAIMKMMLPRAEASDLVALQGFLEKPDELYMRYFIYNYFRGLNPGDPGKAWSNFVTEIREVNRRFSLGGRMGYETDRGIVWLRYGEPIELVRVPNEPGSVPYEIWRYNQGGKISNGGGVVLFYSPGALANDFQILHSTIRGERYNPDWRTLLFTSGRSTSTNSRAEEYITK